jgi:hypothetical protein
LVRGTKSKGHFVQGAQHPRAFGRGHIGRGHINPASTGGGGRQEAKEENSVIKMRRSRCSKDIDNDGKIVTFF